MQRYLGLTWDHPRGTDALRVAAQQARAAGQVDIIWEVQSLEGFEAHPIAELAKRHDLIVLDHPHLGDARSTDCLRPLGPVFGDDLADWRSLTVGASFDSYADADGQWALPLDAATQVMIRGARVETPPGTLEELLLLRERARVIPCFAGPHAALMFMALCVGLGKACTVERGTDFADPATAIEALDIMARFAQGMRSDHWEMNPIDMHQAVADGEVDLCPWVYGYAPYGRPGPAQVRFSDVVRLRPDGRIGSVLGGTGLAITRRAKISPALVAHIRWLMSTETQLGLIPTQSGQPSHQIAWDNTAVNETAGGFYAETRRSMDSAWVRPRWPGYTAFQAQLSNTIRSGVRSGDSASVILTRCEAEYHLSMGVPA